MSDFYHSLTPKANKVHACGECSGFIQIGEKYHRHSGSWEGDFYSIKNCSDCEDLRLEINQDIDDYEDKIALGRLGEYCHDSRDHTYAEFLKIRKKRGGKMYQNDLDFLKEWEVSQ